MKGSFITSPKPFAIIRYAEVLLEYVEALNNVTGTVTVTTPDMTGTDVEVTVSRDVQEMAKYFNMIRYRVGLPGPVLSDMNDANRFEQIIRNERQVELFNEGYRYFDTRRWGTFLTDDANMSNWRGLDVQKDRTDVSGNPGFWNIVTIDQQNIRDRVALPKIPVCRINSTIYLTSNSGSCSLNLRNCLLQYLSVFAIVYYYVFCHIISPFDAKIT